MEAREFKNQVLQEISFQTLEIKKKQFCTMSFGEDGYIWFVQSGLLMTARNTEEGRVKGIGLYDADAMIGVGGIHSPRRNIVCYALGHSTLHYVPTRLFDELMKRRPDLCYFMMCYISRNLLDVFNDLEVSVLGTLEEQIIAFEQYVRRKILPKDVTISEISLAMAVGAHPGSISRARRRLKTQQLGKSKKPNDKGRI